MADELKPCPFCAGNVTELVRDDEESIITCQGCKRFWTITRLWDAFVLLLSKVSIYEQEAVLAPSQDWVSEGEMEQAIVAACTDPHTFGANITISLRDAKRIAIALTKQFKICRSGE